MISKYVDQRSLFFSLFIPGALEDFNKLKVREGAAAAAAGGGEDRVSACFLFSYPISSRHKYFQNKKKHISNGR
jgi:hypothetical protein